MNPTRKVSVVPDARLLIEEWEREAAGQHEPNLVPPSHDWLMFCIGLMVLIGAVLLVAWVGWSLGVWLCRC